MEQKHLSAVIVVVMICTCVAVGLALSFSDSNESVDTPETPIEPEPGSDEPAEPDPVPPAPSPEEQAYMEAEAIIEYTIERANYFVNNRGMIETPDEGTVFYLVHCYVENVGDNPLGPSDIHFKMQAGTTIYDSDTWSTVIHPEYPDIDSVVRGGHFNTCEVFQIPLSEGPDVKIVPFEHKHHFMYEKDHKPDFVV